MKEHLETFSSDRSPKIDNKAAQEEKIAQELKASKESYAAENIPQEKRRVFVIFAEPKGIFPGEFSKIGTPNLCTRKPVLRFLRSLR